MRSAEPPSITEASPSVVKAALSHSVNLTCRAFGAPTPVIVWSRDKARTWSVDNVNQSDTGQRGHFIVDDVGTLTIQVTTTIQLSCLCNRVENYICRQMCNVLLKR